MSLLLLIGTVGGAYLLYILLIIFVLNAIVLLIRVYSECRRRTERLTPLLFPSPLTRLTIIIQRVQLCHCCADINFLVWLHLIAINY